MTSFCVKTNNKQIIDYLLRECEDIDLDKVILTNKKFKYYNNFIIHYIGDDINKFYDMFTKILTSLILEFYETEIVRKLINSNYFYFSNIECKQIFLNTMEYLLLEHDEEIENRKDKLYDSILEYIIENKSIVIDGFVNFRISDYMNIIDELIDLEVNKFLIEREYSEFINLLKLYINSKDPCIETIHLIYINKETILVDDDKNIINIEDNLVNAKYLSDISFSSNDYALNTLLNIIPEKIIVHLIDESDEFINTLDLIFEDRICICKECSLCETYKIIDNKTTTKR